MNTLLLGYLVRLSLVWAASAYVLLIAAIAGQASPVAKEAIAVKALPAAISTPTPPYTPPDNGGPDRSQGSSTR